MNEIKFNNVYDNFKSVIEYFFNEDGEKFYNNIRNFFNITNGMMIDDEEMTCEKACEEYLDIQNEECGKEFAITEENINKLAAFLKSAKTFAKQEHIRISMLEWSLATY